MKIVNLTPHVIHLPGLSIKPSKPCPRCVERTVRIGEFCGVELIRREYGAVYDMPEPEDGTLYIVSMLVRLALPHRSDLASPGDFIRDDTGKIVGSKNLIVN